MSHALHDPEPHVLALCADVTEGAELCQGSSTFTADALGIEYLEEEP